MPDRPVDSPGRRCAQTACSLSHTQSRLCTETMRLAEFQVVLSAGTASPSPEHSSTLVRRVLWDLPGAWGTAYTVAARRLSHV